MRKLSLGWLFILLAATAAMAQKPEKAYPKAVVNDMAAKRLLLGAHRFSLQWISWDYFGKATVTERNGALLINGEQRGRGASSSDYVTMNGVITRVDAKAFTFEGEIVVQVSHNNEGKPCRRTGEMTFRITGNRRYWRLVEMKNPCEDIVDYVDIYFR